MNPMQQVRIAKATVNIGVGEAGERLARAEKLLESISNQKPVRTTSKVTNPEFGIRKGQPIACKVTLRGERMWSFYDRLVNVALPRVRDFRGISPNAFDGRGNYTLGFREQLVFPEIDYDKIKKIRGMDITIVTTAKTDEEAYQLLKGLGFPFQGK